MPVNQQEIAHSLRGALYSEEGVLVGIGVLLLFLGVFSSVPMTSVISVVTGAFLFYTAYRFNRSRNISEPVGSIGQENGSEEDAFAVEEPDEFSVRKHSESYDEEYFTEPPEPAPSFRSTPAKEKTIPEKKQFTATDFFEASPRTTMSSIEPQSEFNSLLVKVLQAVKEVCFAHTAAFFWINHETKQLVLEAKITESSSFMAERKISLGTDVVSRIGQTGEPEIVNNILSETERDILRYYSSLQDVKSFIGVPVFLSAEASGRQPIGVIAVDSKAEDAFGDETVSVLSHFSKLISTLVANSTEMYDLAADVKLIRADAQLKKRISLRPTLPLLVNSVVEELENVIGWDAICVVMFDESQRAWALSSVRLRGNEKFVSPKQLIDLDNSVAGNAIRTNAVVTVDLAVNRQMVFNPNESGSDVLRQGMLAVVPFSSNGKCYGAVAVINKRPGSITRKEIAAIGFLSSTIAPSCEIVELNSIVGEHIAIDEQTGVYSKKYFSLRLGEELSRSNDRQEDLTMVLVSLSNVTEIGNRYGAEGKEAALVSVAQHVRRSVRPYDVVARFDAITFSVLLADTIANDAYIWADKLRTTIAGGIVTFDKRSFSISVTIGISGAGAGMTADELMKNTALVLDQARKAGGNIVRVF